MRAGQIDIGHRLLSMGLRVFFRGVCWEAVDDNLWELAGQPGHGVTVVKEG
jgi:hypothetical protein